jgi:hypothetical protein
MAGPKDPAICYDIITPAIVYNYQGYIDTFIKLDPEVKLIQAQQETLDEEFSLLGTFLQSQSEGQNTNISQADQFQLATRRFVVWVHERVAIRADISQEIPREVSQEVLQEVPQEHIAGGAGDPLNFIILYLIYFYCGHLAVILPIPKNRRPPPRGRRRSCDSINNPRTQPSILSENLSRFAISVCQSARPLSF